MKTYARTYQAELSVFLLARIAEDELVAQEYGDTFADDPRFSSVELHHEMDFPLWLEVSTGRMLAECEAKRRIVEQAIEAQRAVDRWTPERLAVDTSSPLPEEARGGAYNEVLRYLAAPYGDHPDFPEE